MFYVNLADMKSTPTYELEGLAYHEGIPGHHMQIAIAQELQGIPKFRRLGSRYTAFSEGWGLYTGFVADGRSGSRQSDRKAAALLELGPVVGPARFKGCV